jgi:hypothetical protein
MRVEKVRYRDNPTLTCALMADGAANEAGLFWAALRSAEGFLQIKKRYADAGITVWNIGNTSVHNMPEVTLNLPGRDQKVEEYKQYRGRLERAYQQLREKYNLPEHMALRKTVAQWIQEVSGEEESRILYRAEGYGTHYSSYVCNLTAAQVDAVQSTLAAEVLRPTRRAHVEAIVELAGPACATARARSAHMTSSNSKVSQLLGVSR